MKTPQEKKRLSLAKDRRNAYGESNKGSRIAIPLNKASQIRAERRAQNRQLLNASTASDEDELTAVENGVRSTSPRPWRKMPDAPLGKVLEWKLQRRRESVGAKLARKRRRANEG
jgi:hypothetical protein